MILSYFIPERIGGYFLFSKRTASIIITKRFIRLAVVRSVRTQRFIEQLIEEPIETTAELSHEDRISQALARILVHIKSQASLIALFPSIHTIHKILTLPLMSEEKIKMIVPFEIESTLPFSLDKALIDSIVLDQDTVNNITQVLVIATRKKMLEEYISLYTQAECHPTQVTTEVIALFDLCIELLQFKTHTHPSLMICIEDEFAHLLLIKQKKLLLVRTLAIARGEPGNTIDTTEIVATAHYFLSAVSQAEAKETRFFLCGSGIDNQALHTTLTSTLQHECEVITASKILHSGMLHTTLSLTPQFLLPLAAALPSERSAAFNLDREYDEKIQKQSLFYQFFIATGLIVALFGAMMIARFFLLRSLANELHKSEAEAIELLKSRIQLKDISKKDSLDQVNAKARRIVSQAEDIWFSLSGKNRSLVLLALQELSKNIDREKLGLHLQEISLSESTGTMIIKGEVKDFPELTALTDSLKKSDFFKHVPNLQEKKFTAKIDLDVKVGDS